MTPPSSSLVDPQPAGTQKYVCQIFLATHHLRVAFARGVFLRVQCGLRHGSVEFPVVTHSLERQLERQ